MGRLRDTTSGLELDLRSRHRIGRAEGADLRLVDPRVSGDHALLRWELGNWVIQDLASTNGVFVNGERAPLGEAVPLDVDAGLGFGSPEVAWRLVDDSPPVASATSGGERRVAVGARLGLPSDVAPRCVVALDASRGWLVRDAEGERLVADGDTVHDGEHAWVLRLPLVLAKTTRASRSTTLSRCRLVCRVSQDEESVDMWLRVDGDERKVGEQVWGYFVVQLLRARARDAEAGVVAAERGWVPKSQLETELKTTPNQVNVWIHRFRRRMAELGVEDGEAVIETRDRGRVIRLGVDGAVR